MDSTISSISTSAPVGTEAGTRVKESHRKLVPTERSCNKSAKKSAVEKTQLAVSQQGTYDPKLGRRSKPHSEDSAATPSDGESVFLSNRAQGRTAPLIPLMAAVQSTAEKSYNPTRHAHAVQCRNARHTLACRHSTTEATDLQ
jgi:hypothetical protein